MYFEPAHLFMNRDLSFQLEFGSYFGPAGILSARFNTPKQAEAGSMPCNNGFGFDSDECISPSRPKPTKQNPKQPILRSQPRTRMFSVEYAQLLAQCKDLKTEIVTGTEECAETREEAG